MALFRSGTGLRIMVSLLISRFGRTIQGAKSPDEIYRRLSRSGYLSRAAQRNREDVLAQIERSTAYFDKHARGAPGPELWRRLQEDLAERHYLSWWAFVWGFRFVSRGWGT